MMKQHSLGWNKELGLAKLLRSHYSINYVNLRVFLRGGKQTSKQTNNLYTGFQSNGQTEEIVPLSKHQVLQLNV